MKERRTLWTSGVDHVDAMNRVGRDRPYTGTAAAAFAYAKKGESLFRIVVEEYPTDYDAVIDVYLDSIDPNGGAE